jgi:hypothetical protein
MQGQPELFPQSLCPVQLSIVLALLVLELGQMTKTSWFCCLNMAFSDAACAVLALHHRADNLQLSVFLAASCFVQGSMSCLAATAS